MSLFPPSRSITLDAALRDLASGTPRARALAAHALGEVADPDGREAALAALVRATDDDRAEVRAEAVASLGTLAAPAGDDGGPGDGRAVPALARRLSDGDARVRQNAAIALGTARHPDGIGPLVEALRDGPADLRFQAATSLAEIDPAAAYDPLVAALADPDPQVLAAIALALGAIGDGRAVAHLTRLVDHADAGVRFDAAYALAELGDGRGRAVLAAGLDDPARAWDAAVALEWLATPEAAAALAALIPRRKADPLAVLRAAGAVLRIARTAAVADADVAAARKALLDGLTARRIPPRGLAIGELATAGDAWAIAPLERLRGAWRGRPFVDEIDEALRRIRARAAG